VEACEENDHQCCVCMERHKNTALGCGHVLCENCARSVSTCPLCKQPIASRLKLYL
jgi:E3 ubiquitin-protein ligase RGLG